MRAVTKCLLLENAACIGIGPNITLAVLRQICHQLSTLNLGLLLKTLDEEGTGKGVTVTATSISVMNTPITTQKTPEVILLTSLRSPFR
jgi:hypothetical protein